MVKSPQHKKGPFGAKGMPFPMPPIPMMPAIPFPFPQPQEKQGFPFAIPSAAQPASDAEPFLGPSSFQLPFSAVPQPYELHENALKGAIWLLKLALAMSEAARTTISSKTSAKGDKSEQDDSHDAPPTAGPIASNEFLNNLVRSVFEASNTDYFYED